MNLALAGDFAIALFIGALIGVEREKRMAEKGFGIGGIRTFILLAEAGAVCAWLSDLLHAPWLFAAGLASATLILVSGYARQAPGRAESMGLTSGIAALTTFLLGGVTLFGHREAAVALGILNSAVLAYRTPIHKMVGRIGQNDLYAALKLLIATFIVLPLLPNRTIDPWGAVNPYRAWWLVILISGLSLAGYVATRLLGRVRGTALTGLFGGLASSTAASLTFARESKDPQSLTRGTQALAAGVAMAWSVMFIRIAVAVAVVFRPLLSTLAVPLIALFAVCAAASGIWLGKVKNPAPEDPVGRDVPLENPFSLGAAMKFAAFFVLVMLLVRIAREHIPAGGAYVIAGLAGLTDVDAITLSIAQLARDTGEIRAATISVIIAVMANTLVKGGIAVALGSRPFGRRVAALTIVLLLLSGAWIARLAWRPPVKAPVATVRMTVTEPPASPPAVESAETP